jgi:hypothetical protein
MSISVTSPSIPSGFTNVKGYATGMLRLSFFTAVVLLTTIITSGLKNCHNKTLSILVENLFLWQHIETHEADNV